MPVATGWRYRGDYVSAWLSITSPRRYRSVRNTPSDISRGKLAICTLLFPIPGVIIRNFDISPMVCYIQIALSSNGTRPAFVHCPEILYTHVVQVRRTAPLLLPDHQDTTEHKSIHESHKPKLVDSRDQNRIRSYIVFHTFWVSASQAHKKKQHKESNLNSYNTIFPSQSHNLPFRVSNATPTQRVLKFLIHWDVLASM